MQQIKIILFYAKPVTVLPDKGTGKVRNMLEFGVLKLLFVNLTTTVRTFFS